MHQHSCDCERFYREWFGRDLTLEKFRAMLADNISYVRMHGRVVDGGTYEAALEVAERLHAEAEQLKALEAAKWPEHTSMSDDGRLRKEYRWRFLDSTDVNGQPHIEAEHRLVDPEGMAGTWFTVRNPERLAELRALSSKGTRLH